MAQLDQDVGTEATETKRKRGRPRKDSTPKVEVKEKGKRGRPRKEIVPHTLPSDFNSDQYQSYRKLYYTDNNEMVSIKEIENRIRKADASINKSIAQTALDIYFVNVNWKTFYSRDKNDQFKTWLQETIPFSSSYAWDLMKCVKELVAYKSGETKAKELDDLLLASIQTVFNKYDISMLRDVIHLPEEVKGEYIEKLLDPEAELDKALVKAKKAELQSPQRFEQFITVIENHALMINDKKVLSLESLVEEDPELAIVVEKAIERAYMKYLRKKESTRVE